MEKRHFHRVGHDARATLFAPGHDWSCRVLDLSLKGCLLEATETWRLEEAQTYPLCIWLGRDVVIELDVVPVHMRGVLAGFRCVRLDLDSATALRRLVELNLGDSALLERDLQALIDHQGAPPGQRGA